jgi:hypothetical protein
MHLDTELMMRDINELKADLCDVRDELTDMNTTLKMLAEAWQGANGVLTVAKWLAGLATTLAALWAVFGEKVVR